MIRKSVKQNPALCINRSGRFALKTKIHAVLSHVWDETYGWNARGSRGAMDPEVQKQGMDYSHFLKFFDPCDAKWLWMDILAIPEIFQDMKAEQKAGTEELRTGILNSSRDIYTRADKVTCLDDPLLRLHSGGMIDVVVVLFLGWLWPFTETWLAKRVLLKTDSCFNLDAIFDFLYKTVNSDDHLYLPIFKRLAPLRPLPRGQRYWVTSPARPGSTERHVSVDIYSCSDGRACDVHVDEADSSPDEQDNLIKYRKVWGIDFVLPSSDCSRSKVSWQIK